MTQGAVHRLLEGMGELRGSVSAVHGLLLSQGERMDRMDRRQDAVEARVDKINLISESRANEVAAAADSKIAEVHRRINRLDLRIATWAGGGGVVIAIIGYLVDKFL